MVCVRKMNNKGFSLVEVIVAMAILAIISIPLLSYFMDSIKYNAVMRTKQQATLEAQSIIEQLKLEDKLLVQEDTANYVTPYFSGVAAPHSYNIDNTTGIGNVVYRCPSGTLSNQYNVEVTLQSDATYNNTPQPVIYGIDETKDVLAVEKEQFTEAKLYFQAIYDSTGRVDAFSIPDNTTRQIHINVSKDITTSYYHVSVYYVYECKDLRNAGSIDTYTSVPLVDVEVAHLESIYLLFNSQQINEQITIHNPDDVTLPHMYFICQSAMGTGYSMTILGLDALEKQNGIVHTNVSTVYGDYGSPTEIQRKELTSNEAPIRLVKMVVAVYPSGSYSDPYVTIESTKGE